MKSFYTKKRKQRNKEIKDRIIRDIMTLFEKVEKKIRGKK